ncbi:hypothetical protein RB623_09995 [Mesorhizobium sp. LHD-90]|uniref:hypothetical protein n=1 Tax=Mesorhizobium sp. LHD-90 TaxID=3071414 RepID=UPI0027E18C62|nr:hypothetical protein [Mesorhizobium sp. LHD-90]MDQ6434379.1 hypothetical protein [Mesorhizobium sp. LHD-90]
MPEAMRPQPIPTMPGVSAFFSFSAAKQACEATSIPVAPHLMAALLRGEPGAIEECVPRGLINSDGSRWSAGVDEIPLPTLTLGRILADALHRRLLGEALSMDGGE